jgi:hypothetical protein
MLDLSYIIQDMKEIKYNNKVYKLPFAVSLPEDPTAEEEISNRFNGEKTKLPAFAVAVYDVIMGSEMLKQWDDHRKGLDWFIKYFPKQYMVLLD